MLAPNAFGGSSQRTTAESQTLTPRAKIIKYWQKCKKGGRGPAKKVNLSIEKIKKKPHLPTGL
jgi:hypothetical protein